MRKPTQSSQKFLVVLQQARGRSVITKSEIGMATFWAEIPLKGQNLSVWILVEEVCDGFDERLEHLRVEEEVGTDDEVDAAVVETKEVLVVIAPGQADHFHLMKIKKMSWQFFALCLGNFKLVIVPGCKSEAILFLYRVCWMSTNHTCRFWWKLIETTGTNSLGGTKLWRIWLRSLGSNNNRWSQALSSSLLPAPDDALRNLSHRSKILWQQRKWNF